MAVGGIACRRRQCSCFAVRAVSRSHCSPTTAMASSTQFIRGCPRLVERLSFGRSNARRYRVSHNSRKKDRGRNPSPNRARYTSRGGMASPTRGMPRITQAKTFAKVLRFSRTGPFGDGVFIPYLFSSMFLVLLRLAAAGEQLENGIEHRAKSRRTREPHTQCNRRLDANCILFGRNRRLRRSQLVVQT